MTFNTDLDIYFGDQKVKINHFPDDKTSEPRKLLGLYRIVKKEKDYWERLHNEVNNNNINQRSPHPISQVYNRFKGILNKLENLNNEDSKKEFDENAKELIDEIIDLITNNDFPTVFSTSTFGAMAETILHKYGKITLWGCFKGYFPDSITALPRNHSNNSKDNSLIDDQAFLKGLLIAQKIKTPELADEILNTKLLEIDEGVNELIADRNDYNNYIEEHKTKLNESYQSKMEEVNNELKSLEDFKAKKEEEIENLHKFYDEKLLLEKPVKQWEDQSKKYRKRGKLWNISLVMIVIAYVFTFSVLFNNLPNINELSADSLRFTLIATVLISSAFLLINHFIKMVNSNYHLANDAQERANLTYVYLALLKEDNEKANLNEEERAFALQSIFSRSESGLIKAEVGTQMPNTHFNQS